MTTKTQHIDITDLEGSSTDGFLDAVKGWLTERAIERELSSYHDLVVDITGAWDMPVKPEWFTWSHPIRTQDYSVTIELHSVTRDDGKLIAHYMVEVTS